MINNYFTFQPNFSFPSPSFSPSFSRSPPTGFPRLEPTFPSSMTSWKDSSFTVLALLFSLVWHSSGLGAAGGLEDHR